MQISIKYFQLAKWTIDNIPCQDGKTVIITGANSGIGFQAARVLASKGAKVIMACRNDKKARMAAGKISGKHANADLEIMHLDLASLESIRKFTDEFRTRYERLDILINNAGVMASTHKMTEDGFEWQFAINHLGHFALTGHLIDLLISTADSRIVTVTSIAHFNGEIHFGDLSGESWYSRMNAYRQSKLANLVFAYELHRKLESSGSGTISIAAHPGVTTTKIIWLPFPVNVLKSLVLPSASRGAMPVMMAATDSGLRGGEYIGPSGLWQAFGYPAVLRSGKISHNRKLWRRLWEVSEEMTGIKYLKNNP